MTIAQCATFANRKHSCHRETAYIILFIYIAPSSFGIVVNNILENFPKSHQK